MGVPKTRVCLSCIISVVFMLLLFLPVQKFRRLKLVWRVHGGLALTKRWKPNFRVESTGMSSFVMMESKVNKKVLCENARSIPPSWSSPGKRAGGTPVLSWLRKWEAGTPVLRPDWGTNSPSPLPSPSQYQDRGIPPSPERTWYQGLAIRGPLAHSPPSVDRHTPMKTVPSPSSECGQ